MRKWFSPQVLVIAAIALQCIASHVVNNRISFFVGDDLNAVALMHQVDFWSFIATPVDVHRVPLHRLVNYVLHNLLPMSFSAATLFMLGCHVASLFVLYRMLQRLHPSRINLGLILAYGLSGYVVILLHWWSAGLHRLPYILFAIISCYSFVRFHQQRQFRFAVLALLSQIAAAGFFIKAVMIPGYWAALLFCLVDFRELKKYRREYALVAVGLTLSLTYVAWYTCNNPWAVVAPGDRIGMLRISLQAGFSIIGQVLLQMRITHDTMPWVNLALGTALVSALIYAPRCWRAVLMGILVLAANLLMIAGSARASFFGALLMFVSYYYAELLFLVALFISLAWQQVATRMREKSPAGFPLALSHPMAKAAAVVLFCVGYAAMGWRTAMIDLRPGPDEDHWKSARYVRNLSNDIADVDPANLNLIDSLVPSHFRFGMLFRKPLSTSEFLSWFGWQTQYPLADKPLSYIDAHGHIKPVVAATPVPLHATGAVPGHNGCLADMTASAASNFTPAAPVMLDRGYLQLDYQATRNATADVALLLISGDLPSSVIDFSADSNRLLVDVGRLGLTTSAQLAGVRVASSGADICIRAISVTPY